ncbi:hypothetical protein Q5530_24265 [Saccharothrix sp. BKS2]|uniref:hypothetical protein n=1 Tax=Saccharothrix sp. BKS2 TaxID=3064400 RepID=UPI0039EA7B57
MRVGRPIAEVSPADLEVHRATLPGVEALTDYVVREHDDRLADLVAAALGPTPRSGLAVLVSESTSGKTRALFEALRRRVHLGSGAVTSLLEVGWWVWPGIAPAPARRFLAELGSVEPRTVIWLDEAQRYLVDPDHEVASAIASALRELVADPGRAPVLVLGTLWPQYLKLIAGRSRPGRPDRFADARLLLAGRTRPVPGAFTGADLEAARRSRDIHVCRAVEVEDAAAGVAGRATRVELTQVIAGVPVLLDLCNTASATERAVLRAAMDARRLGHGEWLPVELLHHAAPAYLTEAEQRRFLSRPDWFAEALDVLTTELAGSARALEKPPVLAGRPPQPAVRLHDYLDQLGLRTRAHVVPSQRFWDAVLDHAAGPDDRHRLGTSAHRRHRVRIAHGLWCRAAAAGVVAAWGELSYSYLLRDRFEEAGYCARRAADRGDLVPAVLLAEFRSTGVAAGPLSRDVEDLIRRAEEGRSEDAARTAHRAGEIEARRGMLGPGAWSVMEEILSSSGVHIFTPGCWAHRTSTCDLKGCPNEVDEHLRRAADIGGSIEELFAKQGLHRHEGSTAPDTGAELVRRRVLSGDPNTLRLATRFGLEADGTVARPWDDHFDPEPRRRQFPDPPESGPGNET